MTASLRAIPVNRRRKTIYLTGGGYHIVACGVRKIEDPVIRQYVADHFATYFRGRSESFDPQAWYVATGGKVIRA